MNMVSTVARAEPKTWTARRAMVDNQIRTFDVTDQRVLEAFYVIPRELFLATAQADLAYSDAPLTVSSASNTKRPLLIPMALARMIQGVGIQPSNVVLVVAAGTGYAAAIASELCSRVVALESEADFTAATTSNVRALGQTNVTAVTGPLAEGQRAAGPYDVIVVCGGVEQGLEPLFDQLAQGGRLVVIQMATHEASLRSGKVTRYDRIGPDISSRVLFDATAPVLAAFRHPPSFVF